METDAIQQFYNDVENELFGNIIPFWLNKTPDKENGGFYGRILNNLTIERDAPKSLILNTRILWTFAAIHKFRENDDYLQLAQRAYDYLKKYFYDKQFGGVFWLVDSTGKVIDDKKRIYGQAFMIYALAEFYSSTRQKQVLDEAIALFNLIEKHNYDARHLGYLETSNRNWTIAEEMRLSEVDMNEMKSMNTHLHLMEAYAALYSVWPDSNLRQKLAELIHDFEAYIIDPDTLHFKLFFDEDWHSKSHAISFGHDIEGSWLLCEAAQLLNDSGILDRIRNTAVKMARITATEGLSERNTIFAEKNGNGKIYYESHWWQQVEAVVGFVNAFEISRDEFFMEKALTCWRTIEERFIDRTNGEWFYEIDANGKPDLRRYKVSEWKCPYHNGRACMEIMRRLAAIMQHGEKYSF